MGPSSTCTKSNRHPNHWWHARPGMHTCMYAHLYFIHTCSQSCMYTCIFAHLYTRVHVYVGLCILIHADLSNIWSMATLFYLYIYIYIYILLRIRQDRWVNLDLELYVTYVRLFGQMCELVMYVHVRINAACVLLNDTIFYWLNLSRLDYLQTCMYTCISHTRTYKIHTCIHIYVHTNTST